MMARVEQIGAATLYLGDCLEILPRLPPIDALVCDPPYSSGGQFRGDRMARTAEKYQGAEYRGLYRDFAGDNRDQRSFCMWSSLWLGVALRRATPGALLACFSDWRQLPTLTDAVQCGGWVWRGIAVWDKTEGARPQKGRYRNQAEYVVWGSAGPMPQEGPAAPGVFRRAVDIRDKEHITQKPVAVMMDLLRIASPGALVVDPFMGSGTTGVAALRSGRAFVGIELDPHHFDTACRRIDEAHRQRDFYARAPDPVAGVP